MNFITKLPVSRGHDLILIACDRLLKIPHFIVMKEKIIVERLAKLFRNNMWKLCRLPESIILDRGPQFAAGLMRELNKMLGIEMKLSMAFYPQIDEQTEKMNQKLEQYLRMYINHRQSNWL